MQFGWNVYPKWLSLYSCPPVFHFQCMKDANSAANVNFQQQDPELHLIELENWRQFGNQLAISIVHGIKIGHWTSRVEKCPAWISVFGLIPSMQLVVFLFLHWLVSLWLCVILFIFPLDQLAISLTLVWRDSTHASYIHSIQSLMGESSRRWVETLVHNTWHALEPHSPIPKAFSCDATCRPIPRGLLFDGSLDLS